MWVNTNLIHAQPVPVKNVLSLCCVFGSYQILLGLVWRLKSSEERKNIKKNNFLMFNFKFLSRCITERRT